MIDRPETGLDEAEVAVLRDRHGPNRLPAASGRLWPRLLARQVLNAMVGLLAVAALVAVVAGERLDALAILAVLVLNAGLGFVQDWRAERALAALGQMLQPTARVVRGGQERQIPAEELVPGDLLRLSAGEAVPADAVLLPGAALLIDESALTGESVPVDRGPGEPAHQGTLVLTGRGAARVAATGAATRFGRIAALTAGSVRQTSVLETRVARLSRQIGVAAVIVAAAVVAVGIRVGEPPAAMVMTATALAVSLVPEGLPAVLTVTLALGAAMLVRRQALVRRLPALETLGAATVICTDKTGTLTENRMTAVRIWTPSGRYDVTGTGYAPDGTILAGADPREAGSDPVLAAVLATAQHCNAARLAQDDDGHWTHAGSPTEAALLALALKGRFEDPGAAVAGEVPFSSERKRMSVLVRRSEGHVLHAKGAPESVLAISESQRTTAGIVAFDAVARDAATAAYRAMASDGLRVIALASRPAEAGDIDEARMTFLGLVGLIDPPRPEVPAAVAACRAAGVRVTMITGDGPETAAAIARSVGLGAPEVLCGPDLDALDDDALARLTARDLVLARARPEDKGRVVRALQARGEVVAMTGDGVNDAPALKMADIGIAMGRRGTEVARQAADMVLLDDNFATIVEGIREGRRQFDGLRNVTLFLLASNSAEVIALTGSLLFGWPVMFTVAQLLWINLVTDSVVALALGLEAPVAGQMRRPPRGRAARLVDAGGMGLILGYGTFGGLAALWLYGHLLPAGEAAAQAAAFAALVSVELVTVLAFRSLREPLMLRRPLSNRWLIAAIVAAAGLQALALGWGPLAALLGVAMPGVAVWRLIGLILLPLLLVPEAVKLLLDRRARSAAAQDGEAGG